MLRTFLTVLTTSLSLCAQFDTETAKQEGDAVKAAVLDSSAAAAFPFAVLAATEFMLDGAREKLYVWASAAPSRIGLADRPFRIGAVLSRDGRIEHAGASLDLTNDLPTYMEEPGTFARAGASAAVLFARGSRALLHVCLYSVLSGSGGIAGATDLILKIEAAGARPAVVANLGQTGSFSRESVATYSFWNTALYKVVRGQSVVALVAEKTPDKGSVERTCYAVFGANVQKGCDERRLGGQRVRIARGFDTYLNGAATANY